MSTLSSIALSPAYSDHARIAAQPTKEHAATEVMDKAMVATLAEAVAGKATGSSDSSGRSGTAVPVQLREATLSLSEAQGVVGGLDARLRSLLDAQVNAGTRAGSEPARSAQPALAERTAGGWIANSPFSNLLTLLRELLMKFEKMDRDNSARMTMRSREMTISAGNKGVEKARENLGGAIGGGVVMGAVGGVALQQSMKSTSQQTGSMKENQGVGIKQDVSGRTSGGTGNPLNIDKKEVRGSRTGVGGDKIKSDSDQARDPNMIAVDKDKANTINANDARPKHEKQMASAQRAQSTAVMLNMLAAQTGQVLIHGVNIEAEMTEAERQMALHVVDVEKRTADEQQDQAVKSRDLRDAIAQLIDTMMNMQATTSGHIIGRY